MRFVCEKCHTSMSYPDEKITKNTIRYTCIKCGHKGESSVIPKTDAKDVAETSAPSNLSKWHATTLNTPRRAANDAAWYYSLDGTSHGPYGEDELIALFTGDLKDISESCHVWCRALDGWKPAIEVEPFASSILMPPPPPMPAPRKSDSSLPPLFGGKSGARLLTSSPRTARTSSPDLASLKQRLKTETNLSHEAPTHQAMPALDSLVKAENELDSDIDEACDDTTKVGAVSPFFSFQSLDDEESTKMSTPDAILSALDDLPATKLGELDTDAKQGTRSDCSKVDEAIAEAAKSAKSLPSILGAGSSKPLPSILSPSSKLGAGAKPGISAFGPSSKPAPGIASIFSTPKSAQTKPTDKKGESALPRFAGLKRIADTTASKSAEAVAPAIASLAPNPKDTLAGDKEKLDKSAKSDVAKAIDATHSANSADSKAIDATSSGAAEGERDQFNDFKEDFGDLLNSSAPPSKDIACSETDASMSDWLSSKTNLPSIVERSESEMSLAAISFDDNSMMSNSDQMGRIDAALNSDSKFNADDELNEASLPHIDLESSVLPVVTAKDSSDGKDDKAPVDSQDKSQDADQDKSVDVPDIALDSSCDKSALDSAVVDVPDIALDSSCDKSALDSAVVDVPDIALDSSCDKSALDSAIDSAVADDSTASDDASKGDEANQSQNVEKSAEDNSAPADIDAFSIDSSESQTDLPRIDRHDVDAKLDAISLDDPNDQSGLGGDVAASAILTDADEIVAAEGESAARVAHANAESAEERRSQLLEAIMAQEEETPQEEEAMSEASQLINLRHYEEMARADKRQKNKRLAIIVAAVVAIAAYFATRPVEEIVEENIEPSITSAATAFDTVSGQTISDADIEKTILADDFEIIDMHAEEAPRVQKQAKQPKAVNKNDAALNAMYGDQAQQGETAQAEPQDDPVAPNGGADDARTRRDGRAGVALHKQEFADANSVNGSKAKPDSMQDHFKIGLSAISRSVQECHRREAKNGTMNVSKLYIRFEVEPTGIVEKFTVENDNIPETFIKCIDSKKNRWKFMEFSGKPVSLRQGFILN